MRMRILGTVHARIAGHLRPQQPNLENSAIVPPVILAIVP